MINLFKFGMKVFIALLILSFVLQIGMFIYSFVYFVLPIMEDHNITFIDVIQNNDISDEEYEIIKDELEVLINERLNIDINFID